MKKNRGKLLLIIIVLALLSNIITLYGILNEDFLRQTYGETPQWFRIYQLVDLFVGIAALIGIWFWRKWAVYLFFGCLTVSYLIAYSVLKPLNMINTSHLTLLVLVILWFWAIYRKWNFFK